MCHGQEQYDLFGEEKQLGGLRPGLELTDEVVLDILKAFQSHFPSDVALQTFYERRLESGKGRVEAIMDRKGRGILPRWDKNKTKKLLWPYCSSHHWCLVVVHLEERRVVINCSNYPASCKTFAFSFFLPPASNLT